MHPKAAMIIMKRKKCTLCSKIIFLCKNYFIDIHIKYYNAVFCSIRCYDNMKNQLILLFEKKTCYLCNNTFYFKDVRKYKNKCRCTLQRLNIYFCHDKICYRIYITKRQLLLKDIKKINL